MLAGGKLEKYIGWSSRLARIGPTIIRDCGRPAGPQRILVVGIRAQTPMKLLITREFIVIEFHPKAWSMRHCDRPALVLKFTPRDNVVFEVMIVCVGGERKIRNHRAEVQHGGKLNA